VNEIDNYSDWRIGRRLTLLAVIAGLIGCASPGPESAPLVEAPPPAATTEPVRKPKPSPEDYPVAPFEGDTLYQLLVAEVAGSRSQYDLALEKYMLATRETRDPGVAARATRLAIYLKRDDAALETALIWAEQDPHDIDAHRHAADLLLRSDRLEEAIWHMEAIKNLGGLAKFDVFAYRSASLSPEQRDSLLEAVSEMLNRHPGDEQLMFSKAVLLEQSGNFTESLELTEALLLISENVNVVVMKMSILNSLQRKDEARLYLESKVQQLPDNRRLRLILARLLFEQGELELARVQYDLVLQNSPNEGDVLFALALIAMEQKNDDVAKRYFERMLRWNRRPGEAHYYLGSIAERQADPTVALREYREVGDGYEFVPAQARIASILVNEGRWEEARAYLERMRLQRPSRRQQLIIIEAQLLAERGMEEEVFQFLDEAILADPENIDLLYFRGMTGQRFDRMDILENDLKRVIELDPVNADALNALGYSLTDQTDRHDEALVLIEKALEIKPNEAAFIDSMGWVQYRLNNFDEAVIHLRRALELFKNDEVAAHLGEVLWIMGEQTEANQIWDDALELAPDSDILKNVMKRFRED